MNTNREQYRELPTRNLEPLVASLDRIGKPRHPPAFSQSAETIQNHHSPRPQAPQKSIPAFPNPTADRTKPADHEQAPREPRYGPEQIGSNRSERRSGGGIGESPLTGGGGGGAANLGRTRGRGGERSGARRNDWSASPWNLGAEGGDVAFNQATERVYL